jgi:hypothetical protein
MPQQRIHDITATRVSRLKESVNEQRALIGEKLLTAPDIIEEALSYFEGEHLKAIKAEAKFKAKKECK